jgi:myosin heavy subunit
MSTSDQVLQFIKDSENAKIELRQSISKLEAEVSTLKTANDSLIKTNNTAAALIPENATLKTENAALKTENAALKSDKDKVNAESLASLRTENSALKKKNAALNTENLKVMKENYELETENAKLETENAKLETANAELNTISKSQCCELQRKEETLEEVKKLFGEVQHETESLKRKLQENEEQSHKRVALFEKQLNVVEMKRVDETLKELKMLRDYSQRLHDAGVEIDSLKSQLSMKTMLCDGLEIRLAHKTNEAKAYKTQLNGTNVVAAPVASAPVLTAPTVNVSAVNTPVASAPVALPITAPNIMS